MAAVDSATTQFTALHLISLADEHASKLCGIWERTLKHRTAAKLILKLDSLGVSSARTAAMEFSPDLTTFLRNKVVVKTAKACLERIHRICNLRNKVGPTPGQEPPRVNVRVFLAIYMIASHPDKVFESLSDPLVQPLRDAASKFLDHFETICSAIRDHPHKAYNELPLDLTQDFGVNLAEYYRAFQAWKGPDEIKLITRIKHALVALFQAYSHLPPDEPANSQLRLEFCAQVARLLVKLREVGGANAVAAFMENNPAPDGIVVDGSTLPTATGEAGILAAALHAGASAAPGNNAPAPLFSANAAYPDRLSNEDLAHALLIDSSFTIGDHGTMSSRYQEVRNRFHRAFWDSLISELTLRPNPCFTRVMRVIEEIRSSLCDLGGVWPMEVDTAQLQTRAVAGSMAWEDFVAVVRSILAAIRRAQSPARVDETNARWAVVCESLEAAADSDPDQPRAFCSALEFLLDCINIIRIDSANARLRLIAPVVAEHGIFYEVGKFDEKINAGSITLDRTTAWLRRALASSPGASTPIPQLHARAMVSLVFHPEPLTQDNIPETLALDVRHLAPLQSEVHYITSAATLLIMAARVLGEDNTQPCATPESIQVNAVIHAQIADTLVGANFTDDDQGVRQVRSLVFCYASSITCSNTHTHTADRQGRHHGRGQGQAPARPRPVRQQGRPRLPPHVSTLAPLLIPPFCLFTLDSNRSERIQRLWEQTIEVGAAPTSASGLPQAFTSGIPPPAARIIPRITKVHPPPPPTLSHFSFIRLANSHFGRPPSSTPASSTSTASSTSPATRACSGTSPPPTPPPPLPWAEQLALLLALLLARPRARPRDPLFL